MSEDVSSRENSLQIDQVDLQAKLTFVTKLKKVTMVIFGSRSGSDLDEVGRQRRFGFLGGRAFG